jgi:hypothetical protein
MLEAAINVSSGPWQNPHLVDSWVVYRCLAAHPCEPDVFKVAVLGSIFWTSSHNPISHELIHKILKCRWLQRSFWKWDHRQKKITLGMSQSSCFVWFWKQTSNSRNCIVLYFWSFLSGLGCVYFMVRRCHSNDSLGGQSCIEYWTRLRKDYATRSPSVATSWYIKNIQKQLETSCFYWNFELTDLLRSWTSLFVTKVPPLLDQGPSLGFGWLHCLQLCKM